MMLHDLNPSMESLNRVSWLDRDCLLGDDRAMVDLFVDEVDGDARQLHSPLQSGLDCACTGECRQE